MSIASSVALVVATLAAFALTAAPAGAAVLTVTTTTDGGAGSLRAAVETLAVNAGGDEVVLQAGATYTLTCGAGGDLNHGNTPLTITGNGATITIAPGCNERLLSNGTGALVIRNVVFSGVSLSSPPSGAVLVGTSGPLTLDGVTVSGNSATSTNNLSLFTIDGTTTVTNTSITNTTLSSDTDICGVFCTSDTISFTDSSVSGVNFTSPPNVCGVFCPNGAGGSAITLTRSSVSNVTMTSDTNVCAVFCGGLTTLNTSTVTGTSLTSTKNVCGVFCTQADGAVLAGSTIENSSLKSDTSVCGVFCSSSVTMTDSLVTNTSTDGGTSSCGAVTCGTGSVTMTRSAITGVTLTGNGWCAAAFCSEGGTITLVDSTLTGIAATVNAGDFCAAIACAGDLVVKNSTIAGNELTGSSAVAQFFVKSATLVYATVVDNTSGGAPLFERIPVTAFGSVITGTGGSSCVGATTTSQGYNFADDTSCGLTGTGDRQGAGLNPLLGAIGANGGLAPTMVPQTGSPLIDAIPNAACQTGGAVGIVTDERSLPRPSPAGTNCDIGAVEVQPAPVTPIATQPAFTG